jgi:bifunctional non-homologous end joining protein LigD
MGTERFGRYSVELSNTDKVLFPDAGITKGDLIDYYQAVADVMIPHTEDRPLTLHRFPDGIAEDGFYQQESADYFPAWIRTRKVARAGDDNGDPVEHVLCNNRATLVYLANQAVIALHGWLARAPRLSRPDRLIFDLDPADHDFAAVRRAARRVVALMQELGMTPYAMTTGSRGLHIVAPLRADRDFDQVRALAQDMAAYLAARHPDELTAEQRKNKRRGRIYLDVMRNAYGQTGVMPYAVRALPGAPVATPLDLDELGDSALDPQRWHIGNILRRLGQKGDPWSDIRRHGRGAGHARDTLQSLGES